MGNTTACACVQCKGIRGTVCFYRQRHGLWVKAEIYGLEDGFHGFHIHEGSDCGHAGGHFAPGGTQHPDHAGDLPPLLSCDGRSCMEFWTGRLSLEEVLGKVVVIHEKRDDFTTQPSGDAGAMIACGVIRLCK